MATTLLGYDEKRGVFLHPDAIKLEPLLGKLRAEDLLFIVLTTDYNTPYKQMTLHQKSLTSSRRCFGNDEYHVHEKRLKKEIELYNSLQYDFRRETQKNYRAKIAMLNINMMAAESPVEIKNISAAIDMLTKSIEKIEHELYTDDLSSGSLDYDGKLSMLEVWQMNKRRSKNDTDRLAEIQQLRSPIKKKSTGKKKKPVKEESEEES